MGFPLPYHQRVMGAMVVILALAVALVRWWPVGSASTGSEAFRDRGAEPISIQEVQPTSQSEEKTPPPPAPLPPVVVPDEVLVEQDLEIGKSELRVESPENDERLQEGADRASAARQPDTGARLLRNVQPNYPAAARDEEIRARIEVEVQIDESGQVQDAQVRRRWRLSEGGTADPVSDLDHGLEEAALSAARRSLFRPARSNGRPVTTRKTITFTFGVN